MELFLDRNPDFLKEAAFAARLGEQPENWPQELTSELLKQLPFLSDYDLNVNLDRVDAGRGFAFGYADVANKTERPEVEHEQTGLPHIRIPVIVMDRAVKPFSVFLDGEHVLPLTEDRIRTVLFNPSTFDISTSAPRDPSLVEPLMPPQRSGVGMGGEYKMASAQTEADRQKIKAVGNSKEKKAYEIKADDRKDIPKKQFAQPGKKAPEGGGKGKYPIPDAQHYRSALGFAKMHGDTKAYAAIKAKGKAMGYGEGEKEKTSEAMPDPTVDWSNCTCPWHAHLNKKEKKSSLLIAIAPTLRESDVEKFTQKLASDPFLVSGFKRNGFAPVLVEALENTKRASADERLVALAGAIEPSVVTLQKLPGGEFLVKSANVNAFAMDKTAAGQVVPQEEAAGAIGPELSGQMQPGQTATAVSQPVQDVNPAQPSKAKVVDEFGQFKVQDEMGNSLLGHVFPQTLAWDGNFTPQPLALFTNGSAYAIQDSIAGEMVGKGTNLPSDTPRGDGCFYSVEGGEAVATAPLSIGSSFAGPDGLPKFQGTDIFGQPVVVTLTEGLKTPMRISDNEYALPDTWKFMCLNNQTQLAQDPVQMNKAASARDSKNEVVLFYNGSFQLQGGCGLEKLSSDFRYDMDPVTAEFMLGVLGVDGATAKMKVAEARKKGSVKLAHLKTITLLGERYAEAEKTASVLLKNMPELRRDLTKEAAALDDEGTVDAILSLNFVNPENLATFVNYIPELEETGEKLAEMLLFSYLGMNELPESAVERAMKNLEEVVNGLKGVATSGVV